MRILGHEIGVCSWSIRPVDLADLAGKVNELGLSSVQLALGPLMGLDEGQKQRQLGCLRDSGIEVSAGMIDFPGEDYTSMALIRRTGGFAPDELWEDRRRLAIEAGKLSAEMGVKLLSCHIGFVPPSSAEHYVPMVERVRGVAKELANHGVELLMETGQEEASELLQFLNDLGTKNVHVNFDPANMILYGAGDPIEAIGILGRHIRHVHVKDAVLSDAPGMKWGNEVAFGRGQVGPERFLEALDRIEYRGPLVIERESGEERMGDVKEAIAVLEEAGVKE
ncbi:MAG: sugar phosphate isomerase/epimerase [Phycisphaerales bacterium]|nr:sugar phosphate isomerase/epimerase [Phycisphaerales bacterium]